MKTALLIAAVCFFSNPCFAQKSNVDQPIDLLAPRLPQKKVPAASATESTTGLASYDRLAKDNIRVSAHTLESGSKSFTNWSTSWGSHDTDTVQRKLIEISLSEIGNSGAPAIVEFFRVLKPNGGRETFVKSEGGDVKTDGKGTWCVSLIAGRNDTNYRALGVSEKSGERMTGYFVRVIRDNRIVGYAASPSVYDRFALDTSIK